MRQDATQSLVVERLVKIYQDRHDRVRAVDDVSFEVPEGRFYTLLGPSGCGKTTTLRCVAGLERTDSGRIIIDGTVVSSHVPKVFVPPYQRSTGMVFQSYAIWPHMTVFENVAFPLRVGRERLSEAEVRRRVEEALALVRLEALQGRLATQLSGGQQQRLALARALVRQPKLLLLDEPLSNLDAKLREHMRTELRQLQRRLGITTLYVTHDQIEALSMSNRIGVMADGRIVQEGTPRELYQRPASQFVASFVGRTNLLEAEVLGRSPLGGAWLDTAAGRIEARCPDGVRAGDRVTVSVRPEHVVVRRDEPAGPNALPGEVELFMFLGEFADCRVRVGATTLLSRRHPGEQLHRGERVCVELPIDACTVISDDHGVAAPTLEQEEVGA